MYVPTGVNNPTCTLNLENLGIAKAGNKHQGQFLNMYLWLLFLSVSPTLFFPHQPSRSNKDCPWAGL
jgi:hypothetical protein